MAEEQHHVQSGAEEVKDRGMFDFLGKKEGHHDGEGKCEEGVVAVSEVDKIEGEGKGQEEALTTNFDKIQVTEGLREEEQQKEKGSLLEKLHRSHSSSSSSSSDEEDAAEGETGENKKKKKKSLKDKIKEKISGEKKEETAEEHKEKVDVEVEAATVVIVDDNAIPVEKIDELAPPESETQDKKSLLDKIKEKLPGGKKPTEEAVAEQCTAADQAKEHHEGDSPKEKKGILGKIMDKIPGYHKGNGPEETSATH